LTSQNVYCSYYLDKRPCTFAYRNFVQFSKIYSVDRININILTYW